MSEILDKLQKLQALKDRAGTEQEAAVASLRIKELLEKHNLEIGVLELREEEGTELPAGPSRKRIPDHWPILAHACNELFDVQHFVRGSKETGWQYCFIGLRANVQTATIGFQYLIDAVAQLAAAEGVGSTKYLSFCQVWFRPVRNRANRRAFECGASQCIYDRIRKEKASPPTNATTRELILVGNGLAKRMFARLEFEDVPTVNTHPGSHVAAYVSGYNRGGTVNPRRATAKRLRGRN